MSKLRVDLYTRQDCLPCSYSMCGDPITGAPCELCMEARDVVKKVSDELSFALNEIDIASSEDLKRRYSDDIPTIFINGKKSFKFKVDEAEFRKKVKREIIKRGIILSRERNKTSSL
ncbi:MAG: glutaredoxin family protein [Thermodesulfobacteriota bacterium]